MSQHVTKSLMTRASALLAGRWVQDALRLVIFLWLARTMVEGYGLFIFAVGVAIIMRAPCTWTSSPSANSPPTTGARARSWPRCCASRPCWGP